jgi:hypothetical protein
MCMYKAGGPDQRAKPRKTRKNRKNRKTDGSWNEDPQESTTGKVREGSDSGLRSPFHGRHHSQCREHAAAARCSWSCSRRMVLEHVVAGRSVLRSGSYSLRSGHSGLHSGRSVLRSLSHGASWLQPCPYSTPRGRLPREAKEALAKQETASSSIGPVCTPDAVKHAKEGTAASKRAEATSLRRTAATKRRGR